MGGCCPAERGGNVPIEGELARCPGGPRGELSAAKPAAGNVGADAGDEVAFGCMEAAGEWPQTGSEGEGMVATGVASAVVAVEDVDGPVIASMAAGLDSPVARAADRADLEADSGGASALGVERRSRGDSSEGALSCTGLPLCAGARPSAVGTTSGAVLAVAGVEVGPLALPVR